MKERFVIQRFNRSSRLIIGKANEIIDEYRANKLVLTLRQLYYQFVARGYIPNTQKAYKRLGAVISDARLGGEIDWEAIVDNTRFLRGNPHFDNPLHAAKSMREGYGIDMWANQKYRLEVWIEKDALTGVIESVCTELDVPFLACRGYVSQSEQWRAAHRLANACFNGQKPIIIHLGDHDPSGIDMTRDNDTRLFETFGVDGQLHRIALNMDQVRQYDPPENPAKHSDSRYKSYEENYGKSSWELDALDPRVIQTLVRDKINEYLDPGPWEKRMKQLKADQKKLDKVVKGLSPKKRKKKRKSKRKSRKAR